MGVPKLGRPLIGGGRQKRSQMAKKLLRRQRQQDAKIAKDILEGGKMAHRQSE